MNFAKALLAALAALSAVATIPAAAQTKPATHPLVAEGEALLKEKQYEAAGDKFKAACDKKVGEGCYRQAVSVERYRYAPATYPAALALYEKACSLKWGQGCFSMALFNNSGGLGLPVDKAKGLAFMDKACTHGFAAGCRNLGEQYHDGRDVTKDLAKSFGYYKRGCDLDYAEACKQLALAYALGQGTAKDKQAAIDAILKAEKLDPRDTELMRIGQVIKDS